MIAFNVINKEYPISFKTGGDTIAFSVNTGKVNVINVTDRGIIKYSAGENLGGHRVVYINAENKVVYASNLNLCQAHKILGITTGACEISDVAIIQTFGLMEEVSWTWDLNLPIYLSDNGLITQSTPATGFILQIAFPITSTKIFIDKKTPIIISAEE
jgi:hypothetical protein